MFPLAFGRQYDATVTNGTVFPFAIPATVDWYDLDYPSITELRQQLLPPRAHYTLIGSSVTDLTWLDRHPRLEFVDEAPMNDSPILMAKAPANVRRILRLMNLLPGMKRSTRIVRFRF